MDTVLAIPTQPWRPAEEMLDDLERLNDAIVLKLDLAGRADVEARYHAELVPKLDEVRRLVARKSPIAKNALEDAIVMFREFHITALATVVPAPF
jgi:hypothetical protein